MLAWSSRSADSPTDQQPNDIYLTEEPYESYYEPPKKKVDAIAEAWGIHEPEPFEEFFAGGGNHGDTPTSSIYGGKEGHTSSRSATYSRRKDSRDLRETHRDSLDDTRRAANRRSVLPPPQPIFIGDAQGGTDIPQSSSPPANRPDGPKRNKSLINRFRKMRDAPNVPVNDDVIPPSPTSMESSMAASNQSSNTARPTHRSQHSFLARFAGGRNAQKDSVSPTSEAFVFIEDSRSKDLPPPPSSDASGSGEKVYEIEVQPSAASGPASPGLVRTSSLLRKVRGVVKGTK